jgi:phosphoribosylanthranilate isomerase
VDPRADRLPAFACHPEPHRPAVLDAGAGGRGRRFRWELLGPRAPDATFIAGGIGPHNVLELLRYRPYGLDLSSGVESAPGIKDPERLSLFFERLERWPS